MPKAISNGRRFTYAKLAELTWLLLSKPRTTRSLARSAGVSLTAAQNWINAFHAAKCIHIADYVHTPRSKIGSRVWAWGHGDDAPRPGPMTATERDRKSRDRSTLDRAWRVQP